MNRLEQKYINSREVAEMVGKEHNMMLRDIRRYCEQLGQSKIAQSDFFTESTYQNSQNKTMPCYLVTKKGCEFIAHKLTGIKGTEFTAKYINRFHEMEDQMKQPVSLTIPQQLQVIAQGTLDNSERINKVEKELEDFKADLPLLGIECQKITWAKNHKVVPLLGGKDSLAYKNISLRQRVYRDVDEQLRRAFGVSTYKAIKRSQCDLALSIINRYELPLVLRDEIKNVNAQLTMNLQ